MLKQIHLLKTLISASLLTLMVSVSAVAAPQDAGAARTEIPFAFEVSYAPYERLCYAGHDSGGVKYRDGYTITEDASFRIVNKGIDDTADPANLKIEISVLYENADNTKSLRETVMTYEKGDLSADGTDYPFFSENVLENLEERDRLYSDSMQGLEVKLSYEGMRGKRTEKYYYLVCSDDMMQDYESGFAAEYESEA